MAWYWIVWLVGFIITFGLGVFLLVKDVREGKAEVEFIIPITAFSVFWPLFWLFIIGWIIKEEIWWQRNMK